MKKLERITSKSNRLVRLAHAVVHMPKRAKKEGLFAVEGLRLAESIMQSEWRIRFAFFTDRGGESLAAAQLVEKLCERRTPVYLISDELCAALSDTDTPQGVLLIAERDPDTPLKRFMRPCSNEPHPLYVVLDRVQDPGNVGTILRTAVAAGASGIVLLRGCADIYNNKVVRAAMGGLFYLNVAQGVEEKDFLQWAQERSLNLYAAACDDMAQEYIHTDFTKTTAVVFGNEANGVSSVILARARRVYVPMFGPVESLNVSAAAAVILYECVRQRIFVE